MNQADPFANGKRTQNAIYRNQLIILHKIIADVLIQTAPIPPNDSLLDNGQIIADNIANLQVAQLLIGRLIASARFELGTRLEHCEESSSKPASEPTKALDECTCGDCHYFHGPTGLNRYGKEIGECYAQKDAPTVEKDEESCSDFDWKGDKDQ